MKLTLNLNTRDKTMVSKVSLMKHTMLGRTVKILVNKLIHLIWKELSNAL